MQRRKPNAPVKALTLDKRAIRSRRAYRSQSKTRCSPRPRDGTSGPQNAGTSPAAP